MCVGVPMLERRAGSTVQRGAMVVLLGGAMYADHATKKPSLEFA